MTSFFKNLHHFLSPCNISQMAKSAIVRSFPTRTVMGPSTWSKYSRAALKSDEQDRRPDAKLIQWSTCQIMETLQLIQFFALLKVHNLIHALLIQWYTCNTFKTIIYKFKITDLTGQIHRLHILSRKPKNQNEIYIILEDEYDKGLVMCNRKNFIIDHRK